MEREPKTPDIQGKEKRKMRNKEKIMNWGNILKVNLRRQYPMSALAALVLLLLTGLLFNLRSLSGVEAAKPLELLAIWIGPILLVPVFLPEQYPALRDVVRAKCTDYLQVCLLRILYSTATVAILAAVFTGIMKAGESQVQPYHLWGCICSALILGAVGLAVAGISGSTASGYMVCMIYYLGSYGLKGKLGVFNLLSMTGGQMTGKGWQLLTAVLLTALTLAIMKRRKLG